MRPLFVTLILCAGMHTAMAAEPIVKLLPAPSKLEDAQETFIRTNHKPDTYSVYVGVNIQVDREMLLTITGEEQFTGGTLTFTGKDSFSMNLPHAEEQWKDLTYILRKRTFYDVTLSTGERYILDQHAWNALEMERQIEFEGRSIRLANKRRLIVARFMSGALFLALFTAASASSLTFKHVVCTVLLMGATSSVECWLITDAMQGTNITLGWQEIAIPATPILAMILGFLLSSRRRRKKQIP